MNPLQDQPRPEESDSQSAPPSAPKSDSQSDNFDSQSDNQSDSQSDNQSDPALQSTDPAFQQQVDRLHQLTVYGRWAVVGLLWLTIGAPSLWGLRYPIALALENFTWAALRYGLVFNRPAAIGLTICISTTAAVLVWQIRNALWGLPLPDRQRLQHQVCRIRQQGSGHPLWRLVCRG
jgi:hypothetical protein